MSKKQQTTDAVGILHRRYVGEDPEREAALAQERLHARFARSISAAGTARSLMTPAASTARPWEEVEDPVLQKTTSVRGMGARLPWRPSHDCDRG
jgi:hypothetical protein